MELELRTITSILPEIALSIAAVLIMVGGAFVRSRSGWVASSLVAIGIAAVALFRQAGPMFTDAGTLTTGTFSFDTLAGTLRWMSLGFGALFVLMIGRRASRDGDGEMLGMLLLIVAGVMLVASSSDLVTMFVALELVSIPTYVLLFLGRSGRRSAEAAAKYFYLSILSSAFFLMALVLIYGLTGTTSLASIQSSLQTLGGDGVLYRPALLAMVMLVAALGFKLTAVPFHFYAADVYLATTNFNAGLLAVVPKVAGLLALARLMTILAPLFPEFGWQLVTVLSILTMTVGNVTALLQKNMRRLMAYSSVAHAGYMLIGVAVGLYARDITIVYGGFAAAFLYLFVYGFASIGTFAALGEVEDDELATGSVASLSGLGRRRPWMAGVIAVCMFSLAGLPPLAGFWGKLTLFTSALTAYRSGPGGYLFLILAIVGALNAAIAAAYYLRIVGTMYFNTSTEPAQEGAGIGAVAAVLCGLVVIIAGLLPGTSVNHFRRVDPAPIAAAATEVGAEQVESADGQSAELQTVAALKK